MRKNRSPSNTNNTSGVPLDIAETEHPFFGPPRRALQCQGFRLFEKKRNRRFFGVKMPILLSKGSGGQVQGVKIRVSNYQLRIKSEN
jgi:hypothetical protein